MNVERVCIAVILIGIMLLLYILASKLTKKRVEHNIDNDLNSDLSYYEIYDEPDAHNLNNNLNDNLNDVSQHLDTFENELRAMINNQRNQHATVNTIIDEHDVINARLRAVDNRLRRRQQQQRQPLPRTIVLDMGFGGGMNMFHQVGVRNMVPFQQLFNPNIIPQVEPPATKKRAKDENIDTYYNNLEKHSDSSQNVHDSQINKYLTRKYSRLLELNNEIEETKIDGITADELYDSKKVHTFIQIQKVAECYIQKDLDNKIINKGEARIRRKKINLILEMIRNSNTLTSIDPNYNEIHEDDILMHVWTRIHHPSNKEYRDSLEISLVDELLDGVEEKTEVHEMVDNILGHLMGTQNQHHDDPFLNKYGTVCINGRAGRMLSCFTLLDADEILQEPEKDLNEVANEAYSKVPLILKQQYQSYKIQNPTLKDKNIEKLYNCPDHSKMTNSEIIEVERFEKHVKDIIDKTLREDYRGIVPIGKFNEIIQNAFAGI